MGQAPLARTQLAFVDEREYLVHVSLCLAIDLAMKARDRIAEYWPVGEVRRPHEVGREMGWRPGETRRLLRALAYLGTLAEQSDGGWIMLDGGKR